MYRLLTVIVALLMCVTNYPKFGWLGALALLAVYMLLIRTFHGLAEKQDKKRKKKKSHRNGRSRSSCVSKL